MNLSLDDAQMVLPLLPPAREADLRAHVVPGWRERAACTGMPVGMFYPDENDQTGVAEAQQVCSGCQVRVSCRATALIDDESGIWGGTTSAERDELRAALSTGTTVRTVLTSIPTPGGGEPGE